MNPPSGPRTWTSPGAVHDLLRGADARARSWRYIWRAAASCPVGDEEDSLRWLVRERNPVLRRSQADLRANGSSAAARHIPARYVTEAVGRPYTVDSHVSALSRLVLGMESPGGEAFAQLDIYTEVDQVAVELEAILGRRAAVVELSNFALTRVDASPALFPTLARLRQVYRDAAGQEPEGEDGQADDERQRSWRGRPARLPGGQRAARQSRGGPVCDTG